MPQFPGKTITFLFTDIEGSTRLWEQQSEKMQSLLSQHDVLLRHVFQSQGGHIFKTLGDAFCVAFDSPQDALEAAISAQRVLLRELPLLRVRMALYTGTAEVRDRDYFGPPLNRAARLLAAGHGGQILASGATVDALSNTLPSGVKLRRLGAHRLRDVTYKENIFQFLPPNLPSIFPPLNTLDNAFKRGMVRALAISGVVVAVLACLVYLAVMQSRRAQEFLAQAQEERGQQMLSNDSSLGLLYLLDAHQLRGEAASTSWASWAASSAAQPEQVLRMKRDLDPHDDPQAAVFSDDGTKLAAWSDGRDDDSSTPFRRFSYARVWDIRSRHRLLAHIMLPGDTRTAAFSPDAHVLATVGRTLVGGNAGAAARYEVRCFDASSEQPVGKPLPCAGPVRSLRFSRDGARLLTGPETVQLWDMSRYAPIALPVRSTNVQAATLSPDGRRVALLSSEGLALVDVTTGQVHRLGEEYRPRPIPKEIVPEGIAFSVDGAQVSALFESEARGGFVWGVWDAAGKPLRLQNIGDRTQLSQAALSPDGSHLVRIYRQASLQVCSRFIAGRLENHPLGLTENVYRAVFSLNGTRLATSTFGKIYLWDTATGQSLGLPILARWSILAGITWSPDGERLASVLQSPNRVELWKVGAKRPFEIPGALASDANTALSQDGTFLAVVREGNFQLWDVDQGRMSGPSLRVGPVKSFPPIVFSPNGHYLAVVAEEGRSVALVEAASGHRRSLLHQRGFVSTMAFAPDGRYLAVNIVEGQRGERAHGALRFWDCLSGHEAWSSLSYSGTLDSLTIHPDGTHLAAVVEEQDAEHKLLTLQVWDPKTGRVTGKSSVGTSHLWSSPYVAFSPDGRLLAMQTKEADGQEHVRLWDGKTAQPGHSEEWNLPSQIYGRHALFSPDGRWLVIVANSAIYGWNTSTGERRTSSLPGKRQVRDTIFSADGRWLAVASQDPTSRSATTGKEAWTVQVLDMKSGQVNVQSVSQPGEFAAMTFLADDSLRSVGALPDRLRILHLPMRRYSERAMELSTWLLTGTCLDAARQARGFEPAEEERMLSEWMSLQSTEPLWHSNR